MTQQTLPHIYLASSSPRRRELLSQIGVRFETISVSIPEECHPKETAVDCTRRLALGKALQSWTSPQRLLKIPLLAADTVVVIDDKVLGKPNNRDDAFTMLKHLSGREHQVITAVAVVNDHQKIIRHSVSTVIFRKLSDSEISAYCDTGEGTDKAGGYGVQGLAAIFIRRLEGSYSNVMGLPLFETAELLELCGISLL